MCRFKGGLCRIVVSTNRHSEILEPQAIPNAVPVCRFNSQVFTCARARARERLAYFLEHDLARKDS